LFKTNFIFGKSNKSRFFHGGVNDSFFPLLMKKKFLFVKKCVFFHSRRDFSATLETLNYFRDSEGFKIVGLVTKIVFLYFSEKKTFLLMMNSCGCQVVKPTYIFSWLQKTKELWTNHLHKKVRLYLAYLSGEKFDCPTLCT
jgi:hypothetical protein